MSGSSALLQAARLWERTSARGTRYMSGRLGGVRVVIMPNRDFAAADPTNSHTHILYFQDGTPTQARPAERVPAEKREPRPRQAPRGGPIDDDPVPF
jgi:hypothetical protein